MSEIHKHGKQRRAGGRCPVCGKDTAADVRPFCSRRCRDVDLNRWLSGIYRIPTEESPEEVESPPPETAD